MSSSGGCRRFMCSVDYVRRISLLDNDDDDDDDNDEVNDRVSFNVWLRVRRRGIANNDFRVSVDSSQFVAAVYERAVLACRDADVRFHLASPDQLLAECCLLRCSVFGTVVSKCDLYRPELRFRETERLLLRPANLVAVIAVPYVGTFRLPCRYDQSTASFAKLALARLWPPGEDDEDDDDDDDEANNYGVYLTQERRAVLPEDVDARATWLDDKYDYVYQIETKVWRWMLLRKRYPSNRSVIGRREEPNAYRVWDTKIVEVVEFVATMGLLRQRFGGRFERVVRDLGYAAAATAAAASIDGNSDDCLDPVEPDLVALNLADTVNVLRHQLLGKLIVKFEQGKLSALGTTREFDELVFRLRRARMFDWRAMQQVRVVPEHFLPLYVRQRRVILACVQIRRTRVRYDLCEHFSRRAFLASSAASETPATLVRLAKPFQWNLSSSPPPKRSFLFRRRRGCNNDPLARDRVRWLVLNLTDASVVDSPSLSMRHTLRLEDSTTGSAFVASGVGVRELTNAVRHAVRGGCRCVSDEMSELMHRLDDSLETAAARERRERTDRLFDNLFAVHRYLVDRHGYGVPNIDRLEESVSRARSDGCGDDGGSSGSGCDGGVGGGVGGVGGGSGDGGNVMGIARQLRECYEGLCHLLCRVSDRTARDVNQMLCDE